MSWTNELYQVYENFHDQTEFPVSMVPIYHSSTKVQIEISIREDGEFSSARRLTKEEELTVLPVTEDSGARSSGIAPMPFTEKLIYLAADYAKYVDAKRAEECAPTKLIATSVHASPSMRREWIEMNEDLITYIVDWSPSMRREWIEIAAIVGNHFLVKVSLHAEGVD